MGDIIIGKHTLESLTSGMYSDPYVVFREYIQNATDSIDAAYKVRILKHGIDRITISLNPFERQIVIEDNGLGVESENAEKTLVSIGNSQKSSENDRGFRGIGRLSALSYCSKLTFETSYPGENVGTRITFNAKKLSDLLMDNNDVDVSVIDVLQKVYSVDTFPACETDHYFRVILNGVDESSGLNKYNDVFDYLSQNVPVPYSPEFSWGKEIVMRLKSEGYLERKYNIFLSFGGKTIPVFKPYKDEFLVDKGKNITDKIKDISIIKIQQTSGELSAIGWLAQTNYLGSIYDKTVKGIRIRKGNILIGDSQTLNVVFKDARFNGWSVGEIFAVDTRLVPNARRDNFEKNPAFFALHEQLTTVAAGIAKDIRAASLKRNAELANAVKHSETIIKGADAALANGLTANKRGTITQKLVGAQEQLLASSPKNEFDEYYQEIAFEELDMLIGNIQGATSYKAINLSASLSRTEKKILEIVFDAIISVDTNQSDKYIEAILSKFDSKMDWSQNAT